MQLQPEQRSRLLCRVIIFELSKFPFLSLSFLANFFEKGNTILRTVVVVIATAGSRIATVLTRNS
jgi:hypothetical protein